MNREQAINYLKSSGMSDEQIRTVIDAFTCEDAMSRQAVIDGLVSTAKVKAKSDAQKSLMGRSMFFVENLPSVTPHRWIPVSERLPKFNDIVLASTDSDYDELRVILTVYGGEEFWFNGKIKAWMPLPAPYKAENKTKQGLAYADQDTLISAT